MSWRDRPYAYRDDTGGWQAGGGPQRMRLGLPPVGRVVKWLLIANIAVFVVQAVTGDFADSGGISAALGATADGWWQLWRYVTFQFCHGGVIHLLFNMLGLYILGSQVERLFGPRKFLVFYLLCGVTAGLAYVAIAHLAGLRGDWPLVGASGGVFGLILAAAVYCPHMYFILLFFPVPIRLAAILIFAVMVLKVLMGLGTVARGAGVPSDPDFWSQVAHFGGALTAGVWVFAGRRLRGVAVGPWRRARRTRQGAWAKKMAAQRKAQEEVDRILDKIRRTGIHSLTGREKRTLKKATEQQRHEEQRVGKL